MLKAHRNNSSQGPESRVEPRLQHKAFVHTELGPAIISVEFYYLESSLRTFTVQEIQPCGGVLFLMAYS